MAYTLADLRNRVLDDKLDDTTFDPDIVDRFINDTQNEIFNTYELPFQEKVFAGVLPAGAYIFTFPSDYQQAQSLVITGPTGNVRDLSESYLDFRQFNKAYPTPGFYTAGVPTMWTIYGNKMYMNKPTDQQYNLTMFYLKRPDQLEADGDVPEIPEEFAEVLVLGAYYRVLARNENFDQASFIENGDYTKQVDLMVGRLGKRQSASPTTMAVPNRGYTSRYAKRRR